MTRWLKLKQLGKFRLLLNIGSYLDINETFIILSFRRNLISIRTLDLISIPTLDKFNFSFYLGIENLLYFMIQNWLVPTIREVIMIFISLVKFLQFMNPYNPTH